MSRKCPKLTSRIGQNADFFLAFLSSPLLPLTDFEAYKEKAFAKLWLQFGSMCADDTPEALPGLLAQSKGVILDVGPGSGEQVKRFSRPENITAIYGVEPGVSLHEGLRESAKKAGLGAKYHVLAATADLDAIVPALVKEGVIKSDSPSATDLQLFDEIACVRVLCGVPDQAATVADLHGLLKPGGRFVICEHVLNTSNTYARWAQRFYMLLGWKQLMGGCDLMRNTMETFLKVAKDKDGGWAKVEVGQVDEYSPTIHVVGVLTKKK